MIKELSFAEVSFISFKRKELYCTPAVIMHYGLAFVYVNVCIMFTDENSDLFGPM